MTATLIAQVVTADGVAGWWRKGPGTTKWLSRALANPAVSFGDDQPGPIPITLGHDGDVLGFLDYLERGIDGGDLRAVGVVDRLDADQVDGLYASPAVSSVHRRGSAQADRSHLVELALVFETAGVAARPVTAWPFDYRVRYDRPTTRLPSTLRRAIEAADSVDLRWRPRPSTLCIHGPARPVEARTDGRPPGPVCFHGGGRVLAVR